jgi:crotonobetainyl-CoA:carnitine CoA-transferase CaiB-like acyl-CoA transferase
MDRLGYGYEEVAKINPSIVYCSCSGYGSTGPHRDQPGQDLIVQAMSGLAMQNGRKSDPPTLVGSAIIDQHAAVLAALGIVGALYERKLTGKGKKVESNLLNAALDLQIEPFNYHLNGFKLYDRSETGISSRFHQAPYGIFETMDGYLLLSLTSTEKLSKVFQDEEFLSYSYQDQFDKREQLNAKVMEYMKQKTTEHWHKVFTELDIWCSLVNEYEDVETNPQVQWNKCVLEFEHPVAGKVRLLSHPIRYNGETPGIRKVPPQLGEDTEEIMKELGYDDDSITDLLTKGILKKS